MLTPPKLAKEWGLDTEKIYRLHSQQRASGHKLGDQAGPEGTILCRSRELTIRVLS